MKDNKVWILFLVMLYLIFPFDSIFGWLGDSNSDMNPYDMNVYFFSISACLCFLLSIYNQSKAYHGTEPFSKKVVMKGIILGILLGLGSSGSLFVIYYIQHGSSFLIFPIILIVVPILGWVSQTEMSKKAWIGLVGIGMSLVVFSGYLHLMPTFGLLLIIALGVIWGCFLFLLHRYVKRYNLFNLLAVQFSAAAVICLIVTSVLNGSIGLVTTESLTRLLMLALLGTFLFNGLEAMIAKETSLLVFITIVVGQGLFAMEQLKEFRNNQSALLLLMSGFFLVALLVLGYRSNPSDDLDESHRTYNQLWVSNQIHTKKHFALLVMFLVGNLLVCLYQEYALVLWAAFFIITTYKKLLNIFILSAFFIVITLFFPIFIMPYLIITFVARLGTIISNKNVLIVGVLFYSLAPWIYLSEETLRDSSMILPTIVILTIGLHVLMRSCYQQKHSSESLFSIVTSTPLLLLSLVLPHVMQGFDDIFVDDEAVGYHNVSGHFRHYQDGYVTYVDAHVRSNPDGIIENNLSH